MLFALSCVYLIWICVVCIWHRLWHRQRHQCLHWIANTKCVWEVLTRIANKTHMLFMFCFCWFRCSSLVFFFSACASNKTHKNLPEFMQTLWIFTMAELFSFWEQDAKTIWHVDYFGFFWRLLLSWLERVCVVKHSGHWVRVNLAGQLEAKLHLPSWMEKHEICFNDRIICFCDKRRGVLSKFQHLILIRLLNSICETRNF